LSSLETAIIGNLGDDANSGDAQSDDDSDVGSSTIAKEGGTLRRYDVHRLLESARSFVKRRDISLEMQG